MYSFNISTMTHNDAICRRAETAINSIIDMVKENGVERKGAFMNVAYEGVKEMVDVEEKILLDTFAKYGAEDMEIGRAHV